MSERAVNGPWRYQEIDDASRWIPLRYSMIDFPPVLRNSQ